MPNDEWHTSWRTVTLLKSGDCRLSFPTDVSSEQSMTPSSMSTTGHAPISSSLTPQMLLWRGEPTLLSHGLGSDPLGTWFYSGGSRRPPYREICRSQSERDCDTVQKERANGRMMRWACVFAVFILMTPIASVAASSTKGVISCSNSNQGNYEWPY